MIAGITYLVIEAAADALVAVRTAPFTCAVPDPAPDPGTGKEANVTPGLDVLEAPVSKVDDPVPLAAFSGSSSPPLPPRAGALVGIGVVVVVLGKVRLAGMIDAPAPPGADPVEFTATIGAATVGEKVGDATTGVGCADSLIAVGLSGSGGGCPPSPEPAPAELVGAVDAIVKGSLLLVGFRIFVTGVPCGDLTD